ncbi:MAG: four helix bundle protein [Campylobacterales bacterium]|nr:four helix bundle protein [Campylobacterales bacterium]
MALAHDAIITMKFIELAKLMNIYLNHFPRHEKYALSQQIRQSAYRVYDLMVEGRKRYRKKTSLTELDITHEQLRMQLYLANELGYFGFKDGKRSPDEKLSNHRYAAISVLVDELGRMIGAWISKAREDGSLK